MAQESLLTFVLQTFPCEDKEKINFLKAREVKIPMKTWKDFAQALSAYESRDDPDISVLHSSTWAVCQDFLGTLDPEDLEYARERGGIWGDQNLQTTVREILTLVKKTYP